jgi:hypothetical protein
MKPTVGHIQVVVQHVIFSAPVEEGHGLVLVEIQII